MAQAEITACTARLLPVCMICKETPGSKNINLTEIEHIQFLAAGHTVIYDSLCAGAQEGEIAKRSFVAVYSLQILCARHILRSGRQG